MSYYPHFIDKKLEKDRFRNSPKVTEEESETSDSNQEDFPDPKINVLNHYGQLLFLVCIVTEP